MAILYSHYSSKQPLSRPIAAQSITGNIYERGVSLPSSSMPPASSLVTVGYRSRKKKSLKKAFGHKRERLKSFGLRTCLHYLLSHHRYSSGRKPPGMTTKRPIFQNKEYPVTSQHVGGFKCAHGPHVSKMKPRRMPWLTIFLSLPFSFFFLFI